LAASFLFCRQSFALLLEIVSRGTKIPKLFLGFLKCFARDFFDCLPFYFPWHIEKYLFHVEQFKQAKSV